MIVGWLKNHIAKANFSGKNYRSVIDIKFANMHQQYEERGEKSVMKCERSVIIMTLYWHNYQVFSLGNCVDDTTTEIGLRIEFNLESGEPIKLSRLNRGMKIWGIAMIAVWFNLVVATT